MRFPFGCVHNHVLPRIGELVRVGELIPTGGRRPTRTGCLARVLMMPPCMRHRDSKNAENRATQRGRFLALLIAAGGGEVPSVELSRISLHYNAPLHELRNGFCIVSRTERPRGRNPGILSS